MWSSFFSVLTFWVLNILGYFKGIITLKIWKFGLIPGIKFPVLASTGLEVLGSFPLIIVIIGGFLKIRTTWNYVD